MKRKVITVLLSVILGLFTFGATGCGGLFIDGGEEIDTTKTQLYVNNYNGGVGTEWLNAAADRFEEKYASTSFEEGRTGVQILINPTKIMRADMENTLKGATVDDVYFAEHAFYASWAKQDLLLDITDIVATKDLSEFGDNGTIADKLSAEKKAMLTSPKGDEKYYGLPHYEGFQGINYNVDVFDSVDAYFNADGEIIGDNGGTKSAGPDNIPGNADDGLPASLTQFAYLCGYLSASGIDPFIWTGQYNEYFTLLLDSLTTSVLGKTATEVLYSFNEGSDNGVVSRVITGFNGDTPAVGTTVINETTGYLLWQREELYYVLDFAKQVFEQRWYYKDSTNGSFDHMQAQEYFVNGSRSSNKIAMLIDGNYWENEASDAIARSESTYNYSYSQDANFAWMPLPTAISGNVGDSGMTLRDTTQAYAFIHANVPENRKEVAKKFLQFCYSNDELINFTIATGMTRDISYELSSTQKAGLSKYAQSMIAYKETADLVNTNSTCTVFQANEEDLTNTFWRTTSGTTYDRPYVAFFNGGISARQFFSGMATLHTRNSWDGVNRSNYHMHDFQTEENITPVN